MTSKLNSSLCVAASLVAVILFFGIGGRVSWPCDSTVRGKAFEDARDLHRLCVISDGRDSASLAMASRLETWLMKEGANLNVELVRLDARDPNVKWEDYGIPSAPPDLPVVMLAGLDRASRRSFVVDHWEPDLTDKDLEALRTSPGREAIRRNAGKKWAVLLYAPGKGPEAGKAEAIIEAVARRWSQEHAPGVSVVRLDRFDPRERLLCSFAGLNRPTEHGQQAQATIPDWIGVVFGRGKLMAPPLEGAQITDAALEQLLSQLIEICSCLRPPSMMGVDIPMAWEPDDEKSVVSLLSPEAEKALAVAGILAAPAAPPGGRTLLTSALSAIALLVAAVVGTTFALVRREKRRRPPRLNAPM